MKIATKTKYLGHLPGAFAMNGADIGEAKIKGQKEKVIITWGRNLRENEIEFWENKTPYEAVKAPDNRFYELIIPKAEADKLLSILHFIK